MAINFEYVTLFDMWRATYASYEPGDVIGEGRTKYDALVALLMDTEC